MNLLVYSGKTIKR